MPIVEVVHAAQQPATVGQKQAFVRSAIEIFRDVLGTPDGRLRIFYQHVAWDDCITGLLEHGDETDEEDPRA